MAGIMKAYDNANVVYLDSNALNADKSKIGLNGSMTEVKKIFFPERKVNPVMLEGSAEEIAKKLCQYLKDDKIF